MDILTAGLTLMVPLMLGYMCVRLGLLPRRLSKPIQRYSVLFLAPPVTFFAMWGLDIPGAEIIGIPLLAVVHCLGGMLAAFPLARVQGMSRPGTGAFLIGAGWSNTWMFGGYLAFLLFGAQGLALAALYNMLNPLLTYIVGFGVANYFSPSRKSHSVSGTVLQSIRDPVIVLPTAGLLIGLGINLWGAAPAAWVGETNAVLVPLFTIAAMFAVGMSMTFRRTRDYVRPILLTAGVKYLIWPLITLLFLFLLGGHLWNDALTFRVLLLLSAMPAASQAMLLSNLFDLDIEMVNAVWLSTTLFSLASLPVLLFLVRL